jgi:hypothetical protein
MEEGKSQDDRTIYAIALCSIPHKGDVKCGLRVRGSQASMFEGRAVLVHQFYRGVVWSEGVTVMRSTIRPEGFSKYAPRWVREGTAKPRSTRTLPPAAQLPPAESADPPWRGPSPFQEDAAGFEDNRQFDGDIRQWRSNQLADAQYSQQLPLRVSLGPHVGLVEKLFRSAAVVAFTVVAIGALGMVLFPDAPKEAAKISGQLAAIGTDRTSSQYDRQPVAKSVARLIPQEQPVTAPAQSETVTRAASVQAEIAAPTPVVVKTVVIPNNSQAVVAPAVAPAAPPAAPVVAVVPAAPAIVSTASNVSTAANVMVASNDPPSTTLRVRSQRVIGSDEIDRLIKRGEAFLEQGDVAAARLVFERAAEARDPRAALALGSTYDPNVLRKMGAVGVPADAEQARAWYERAAEFGSGDAAPRISALAQLSR